MSKKLNGVGNKERHFMLMIEDCHSEYSGYTSLWCLLMWLNVCQPSNKNMNEKTIYIYINII